jgi:putative membrane protein
MLPVESEFGYSPFRSVAVSSHTAAPRPTREASKERTEFMKIISFLALLATGVIGTASTQNLTTSEKSFVEKAAEGNLAEVELGKLAQQKSSDSKVKDFAQQMITDHSKANDQLKPIADSASVKWPSNLTGESKTLYDRLEKLSGNQFDRLYIRSMVEDHKKDVQEYKAETKQVKDPQLKSYVDQTLPIIEQHLTHAESVNKSAVSSTKPGESS